MATPASSAYAFHHRFDAAQAKDAPVSTEPPLHPHETEHLEYPDLDAGQFYSSAATHTAPAATASNIPDFPEFKGFDSKSELFSTTNSNNNFFQQYAPQSVASAALVEPQSAQIEGEPEPDQSAISSAPATHDDLPTQAATAVHQGQSASAPRQSIESQPAARSGDSSLQHRPPQGYPSTESQSQLERHFSSASSYVQQPSVHSASHDSQSSAHRSPLPKPPTMPHSPASQASQIIGAPYQQAMPPQSPPAPHAPQLASNFSPVRAPAPQKTLPQPPLSALNMAALNINGGERSSNQNSPAQSNLPRDINGDPIRTSTFPGMQVPTAGLNANGHPAPVPASVLNDDDGFYQDQQHLNQANGAGLPPQRNLDTVTAGVRPSSFFGVEGDSSSSLAQESASIPTTVSDASAPGTRGSSLRTDSAPRGISTAAGGTGNGPMPSSGGGFGGLGPAGATRPASIAPSVASGPLLDHSHLKVGQKASLLSHGKTLELYRLNAKKTNDPNLIYELAVFMVDAAKTMGTEEDGAAPVAAVNGPNKVETQKEELMKEATGLLKKIADRGHPDAQYFLADCYANGIGTRTGKQDFGQAYTYFVLAAKHGHPDAAYRAGTCYEKGWGCRKDAGKALQFYRKSAAQNHPGSMYRLATAELNGELGLKKNAKEGVKWLKRSAEAATPEFPHALHELALLHERGIDNVLFVDPEYSCELLAQAGEMGYAPSAYKLGVNYEYGRMGCPQDGGLSIHMYNIAAQQNHKEACFALTAWYLVGAPGILPQSDTEAYLWAKKAAEQGLAKAEYAVGYFTEMGIGTVKDIAEARAWYKRAGDHGDKRANQRIAALQGVRGGPVGLAGVGSGGQAPVNRQQQRQEQRQEQRESMHEFGRSAQPTSAPFPASMGPNTQQSYPSPLAMREAQTAQREQQYLANVAANERAQARAMLRHSPSQPEMNSPVYAGPSPSTGLPRPPPMPQHQQQQQQQQQPHQPQPPRGGLGSPPVPFSQPQAYPSYPMAASAAPSQSPVSGPAQIHNPMFPPTGQPGPPGPHFAARPGMAGGAGPGPFGQPGGPAFGGPGSTMPTPPGPSPPDAGKEDEKKKKKGWFSRS